MTTEQLKHFLMLAECLNYTAAAERLFISQSTLSRSISARSSESVLSVLSVFIQFLRSGDELPAQAAQAAHGVRRVVLHPVGQIGV